MVVLSCTMGALGGWMIMFFFFNDTATTEIYTLSLHDALPICFKKTVGSFSEFSMAVSILLSCKSKHRIIR